MVKSQTSVVWGRERRLHVHIIDFVAGVNGVAFNAVIVVNAIKHPTFLLDEMDDDWVSPFACSCPTSRRGHANVSILDPSLNLLLSLFLLSRFKCGFVVITDHLGLVLMSSRLCLCGRPHPESAQAKRQSLIRGPGSRYPVKLVNSAFRDRARRRDWRAGSRMDRTSRLARNNPLL